MNHKPPKRSNNIRPNLANEYDEIMRIREQLNALSKRALPKKLSPAHAPEPKIPDLPPGRGDE
jgi:hypothetical protein